MRDQLENIHAEANKTPEQAAQENMRPALPKRFYKQVGFVKSDEGHVIQLDGKNVHTPQKNVLKVDSKAAASLIAAEWSAQVEHIDAQTMPMTRMVNTAIDAIAADHQPVLEDMIRFASNDLLFYRGEHPQNLVDLQCNAWDPVLDWFALKHDARFETTQGLIHVAQPTDAVKAVSILLKKYDDAVKLACLHTMTSLLGSALLAIAVGEEYLDWEAAWNAAHVDEDFNVSQWGEDYEAGERRKARQAEFHAATQLLGAL